MIQKVSGSFDRRRLFVRSSSLALLLTLFLNSSNLLAKAPKCDCFEQFGRWYTSFGVSLAVDMTHQDERFQAFRTNSIALLASGVSVHTLKFSTNVERPTKRGEGRWNSSFPSGHTAVAFCQAGSIGTLHENFKKPLLFLGFMVGRSRIRSRHHRFGDVVAGAAIGYLWGRYYGRKELNSRKENTAQTMSLVKLRF